MSIDLLNSAASGMDAQRAALDVAARNVAAAEAAGPNRSYARMVPQFQIVDGDGGAMVQFTGAHEEHGTNVDILTEMIAVMNASRSYEADASLFDVGKSLAEKTIDVGSSRMKVEPLMADAARAQPTLASDSDSSAFSKVLDGVGAVLRHADGAENAYANGNGNLGDAIYERARADVVLAVATAAAQRSAQALTTILNLQI